MKLLEKLTKRAQKIYPRILLPESSDQRVIQAALSLSTQKLFPPLRLRKLFFLAMRMKFVLNYSYQSSLTNKKHDLEFIDPKNEKLKNDYAKTLFERRKHKGLRA